MAEKEKEVTNLEAYCVRCKEKRVVSESKSGDSPGVVQSGSKYRLVGWCPKCDTKMIRFLSATKDVELIAKFRAVSKESGSESAEVQEVGKPVASPKTTKRKEKKVVATKKKKVASKPKEETAVKPKAPPKVASKKKSPVEGRSSDFKMSSVLKRGKVSFPVDIFVNYGAQGDPKKRYEAQMKSFDEIVFRRRTYTSLTLAALAITSGRKVNGWKFWKVELPNGDVEPVNVLRTEGSVVKRGPRPDGGGNAPDGLPKYSSEYGPVEVRGDLPRRNTRLVSAAYFVDPKKARFGHVNVFLFSAGEGRLMHVRYNAKGKSQKGSVVDLGKFKGWPDCKPAIVDFAAKKNLQRVKAV